MGHRKGTYDLLEALDRLDGAARRSLRVVLAGDGEIEEVRAEIDRRGLGDVVETRSWLAAPERDALLATSEVFLLPSHAEGLPMAMLEAMSSGLVPIVGRVGAVAEVAHDDVNAILVDPGDPAALSAAIESLVLDGDRRRRLAAGARTTAEGLSVEVWFDDLVDVWTHLAEVGVDHGDGTHCSTGSGTGSGTGSATGPARAG
jgi:glycosyltransferase involved in cell wall biosynthesis